MVYFQLKTKFEQNKLFGVHGIPKSTNFVQISLENEKLDSKKIAKSQTCFFPSALASKGEKHMYNFH